MEPKQGNPGKELNDPFAGATLEIGLDGSRDPEVTFKGGNYNQNEGGGAAGQGTQGLTRDRPGSTVSRRSNLSTGSRTAPSQSKRVSEHDKALFFSKKPGVLENAIEWCQLNLLKSDLDGDLRGVWLLGEVDLWDHEREKMLMITDKTLLVVQYDFVTTKFKSLKRINLHDIHTIQAGDIIYPEKSLMGKFRVRDHGGVRVSWGNTNLLSFGQKWNPFSSDIPMTTFIHHPLLYNAKESETVTYNVDDFCESLEQAVHKAIKQMSPERTLEVKNFPIMVESYASITSLIFNQSLLGFNRDRNGVSF